VLFASDFTPPHDCEWGFPIGGWGGERAGAPLRHDPVIFVHGNHSDAVDWFGVADQFEAAGYTDQELWAISYNGLGGQVHGAPIVCPCPPSPRAVEYTARPDVAPYALIAGQYAANDVNVGDLHAFVEAVLAYTRADQVQLVGHSLGVTVIRKTLFDHPELYRRVSAVVSIAGGNHGTSLCRDMETTLYSCDEVAPNTPWLNRLNARGEAPGPTAWMSIYNGSNNLDPFFLQTPQYDDRQSPRLEGAVNLTYPDAWHSDLRVRPDIVATYLAFLQQHGTAVQAVAGAAQGAAGSDAGATAPGDPGRPGSLAATGPSAPLVPWGLAALLAAGLLMAVRRQAVDSSSRLRSAARAERRTLPASSRRAWSTRS
jgi:pimeloyl-ACP methyl ester carboxylesterase